ncbi:MAG: hypothetical protein KTR25_20590 [Myxococcales bacterium]|nr:hypothetical protein [Myxococcales bacterium]
MCSLSKPREAGARTIEQCQQVWSKAVRSYLTQNRKAAPDGSIPQDMEALDAAARQWLSAFRPACEREGSGDRSGARVLAAHIGVRILAKVDGKACTRFLEYYMRASKPVMICQTASSADDSALKEQLSENLLRGSRRR